MKLLNKDLLIEYGFTENRAKGKDGCTIMTRDRVDVAIKADGSCYYTNMGFDYPLKDSAALKKIYREVRNEELK